MKCRFSINNSKYKSLLKCLFEPRAMYLTIKLQGWYCWVYFFVAYINHPQAGGLLPAGYPYRFFEMPRCKVRIQ